MTSKTQAVKAFILLCVLVIGISENAKRRHGRCKERADCVIKAKARLMRNLGLPQQDVFTTLKPDALQHVFKDSDWSDMDERTILTEENTRRRDLCPYRGSKSEYSGPVCQTFLVNTTHPNRDPFVIVEAHCACEECLIDVNQKHIYTCRPLYDYVTAVKMWYKRGREKYQAGFYKRQSECKCFKAHESSGPTQS